MESGPILVLNAGSSSLKFALFEADGSGQRLLRGAVSGIGTPAADFTMVGDGIPPVTGPNSALDTHDAALRCVLEALEKTGAAGRLAGVGHRVAHGGPDCDCPMQITPELVERLRGLVALAPLHLPANIRAIEAVTELRPDLVQVACFDTAFHNRLPRLARMTGLPRALEAPELRRYGYHGLSYEYIVAALRRDGVDVDAERIVVAHLGNGSSLCAIRGGRSIETTMGFSTLSGVPMGTRSGDIDPGLLIHLQKDRGMPVEDLESLLLTGAGLLGISGASRDMRFLLDRHDDAARDAVRYFCYHVRRHLVGLTAPLGGLDRLVFTGGIGASAAQVRQEICAGLGYLGIELDSAANDAGNSRISAPGARVTVEARQTDEEAIIAEHVRRLRAGRAEDIREAI